MTTFILGKRHMPVVSFFITVIVVISLVAIPMVTHAATVNSTVSTVQSGHGNQTKAPFQFKASASVQKALDLLAKYKLPDSILKTLIPVLGDETDLTKLL